MNINKLLSATIVTTALLFSGCANKDMLAKHSGFLKSYDGIKENDKLEGTRVYIKPDADFTKYENIYIDDVEVVSGISEKELTSQQKKLFEQITKYLTEGYKKVIADSVSYKLVEDKNTPKTLVFSGGISAVEVHFDDMQWYQFTPVTLGMTIAARATYVDGSVRILGEARIVDASTGKVLLRAMRLQKGEEISSDADALIFEDVKPALDAWLKITVKNIAKLRNGVVKYQKNK